MTALRRVMCCVLCWLILPALAQAQMVSEFGTESAGGGPPIRIFPEWHSTDFSHAPTPNFTFTVDFPILTRTDVGDQIFVYDANWNPVLDMSDVSLSTEGALKLDLIWYDESGWDLEFAYLGTEDFSAVSVVSGRNLNPVFYNTIPADPADEYAIYYESNLHGAEFNLRRRLGAHVSLLAGIRGLQLHEAFDIMNGDVANTGVYSKAYNHLWGGQLGGDFRWWLNGVIAFTCTLKAGAYNNNIEIYATAVDASAGANVEYYHNTSDVAFFGEANLGIIIAMGHHFALRLGYMGILTDGIALAPNQNDEFDMFNDTGSVELTSPTYHGGYVGFEATW